MVGSHNAVRRDIVVVGTSAGGLEALRTLVGDLPGDFAAAVFIVLHMAPESPGNVPSILQRATRLRVVAAEDGAPVVRGEIRVAVPNAHLMLEDGRMRLTSGPRENRHRPAIDTLFRSAAVAYGARVCGVVLTGMLDDGSAGVWAVKGRGGLAIVQDPADASFPDMPRNALEVVAVDHVLPLREIAPLLARISATPLDATKAADDPELKLESQSMTNDDFTMEKLDQLGDPSKLTCPECGGALWEMHNPPTRFRCHVGHAYSLHTLFSEQNVQVEAALWAAVRALNQVAHIARRLADQAHKGARPKSEETFREFADDSTRHADRLRQLLEASVGGTAPAS